ncbi:MAG: gliding motility-associated C-terminal domain-containing protein [Bacteroidetes bacterium]|nr:gliding motility-associated C-terminal domain-containing protein [Bacteroidota bacterium]
MNLRLQLLTRLMFLLLLSSLSPAFSQQSIVTDSPLYHQLKAQGKLPNYKSNKYLQPAPVSASVASAKSNSTPPFFKACKEFIPVDSTFEVVPFLAGTLGPPPLYRNDDASTAKITIPFNFCFYGTSFNELYINNNGNISFDGPQPNYRPDSLPTTDFMALAAFWADVDTRNFNSGVVYFKIEPTYMIVTWDSVGYYNTHADKKNSFQLIITDGLDSTYLSAGKNVGFRYGNMEWTTGDIGGINGFSILTTQATVGANKSDSINFVQFGRFGKAGSDYDGPYAGPDGVSWLNGRVFEFNVCSSTNIQPIVNNFNYCDTVYSCIGDTSFFELSFLSPEQNQLTSTQITSTASSGLNILQNTPGIVNTIKVAFIGDFSNTGFQHISFLASDNGPIPAATLLDITIKVDMLNAPLTITGNTTAICPGTTTALTATAGFEKYLWSNSANTGTINAGPGNYYVIGKMGKCYIQSATVNVPAIPVIVPLILGNDSTLLCAEDSTLLTVSNSFPHYLWSNGDTTQSAYHHPGLPYVTIRDTNGCAVNSAPFNVPHFPLMPLYVSGLHNICNGDSTQLTAMPGFTNYLWSNGDTGISVTVQPGLYLVTANDIHNCISTSSPHSLQSYPVFKPAINGKLNYCFGDSTKLSVYPLYTNFRWNTLDTTSSIYVTQGAYFLSLLDENNCLQKSDTVLVSELPFHAVTISGGPNYCPGDSALLIASPGFSTYSWSNLSINDSLYASSGTFQVLAIDSMGCKDSTVIGPIQPYQVNQPVISGVFISCANDSTSLQVNLGFLNYLWSTGASGNPVLLPPGNYTVTTTDVHQCLSTSDTVTVESYPVHTAIISGDSICCVNDSVLLSASSGFISYSWNSQPGGISQLLPPGVYTVEVTDSNNCRTITNAHTIAAFPHQLPAINASPFYCQGDSVLLSSSSVFPVYSWSNGSNANQTYVQSGSYWLQITDSFSCVLRSAAVAIQQWPVIVPQILGEQYYCAGDSVLLHISPGFSQTHWSTGSTTNAIQAQAGVYQITAKDSNNCTVQSALFAVQQSIPQAEISGNQVICEGDSSKLSLSNVFTTYAWNTGASFSEIWVNQGMYYVEVEDSIGCKAGDTIHVKNYPIPKAFFVADGDLVETDTPLQLTNQSYCSGGTIVSTNWTINQQAITNSYNLLHTFSDTGMYIIQLVVTSDEGCKDSYERVFRAEGLLQLPNIVTPNNDGSNDVFVIKHLNTAKTNRLLIFDRWGQVVFESKKYENNWNASNVKDGVYYVVLQTEGEKERTGNLTITR